MFKKDTPLANTLYISYDGATDPLGQSQIIPYLIQLSQNGANLTLLTFDKKQRIKDRIFLNEFKRKLKKSGIGWVSLKYHKNPSLIATFYDVVRGIGLGWWIITKNKTAIIHARSYVASFIAVILKKLTGCKFIFDMRGFWPEERIEGGIWKEDSVLYKVAKVFEKYFISRADWIIVLSRKAKEIMLQRYLQNVKKQIEVIPTCVDFAVFHPDEKNFYTPYGHAATGKFVFVYSGSLGTWYCLEEMINFFKIAKERIKNSFFMLLVTSSSGDIARMLDLQGLGKDDFMVKNLPYSDVPIWLSAANVSISFIKPVASKAASCPTKFAEALACGVPVIINSGIGDTAEITRKEGVGVVIDDFSNSAYHVALDELQRLLEDKEAIRQRCRAVAKEYFSLDAGVEKYQQIYLKLSNQ